MNYINSLFNNYESLKKINYENIQEIIKSSDNIYIINTLENNLQDVLIPKTISYHEEENIINSLISNSNFDQIIIIYGKNSSDETIIKKYMQLKKYGFLNIYIYSGGMFEWLLLQDIYGKDLFPTNGYTLNILKYKPKKFDIKKN